MGARTSADGRAGVPSALTAASSAALSRPLTPFAPGAPPARPRGAAMGSSPRLGGAAATLATSGSRKATVLPEPVCAHAMRSHEVRARGTQWR